MTQPQLGTYEYIALDAIHPSPTNPRKSFDQVALQELALSIEQLGVTVPVLLRPVPPVITNPHGNHARFVMTSDGGRRLAVFDKGTDEENQADAERWIANRTLPGLITEYELVSGERRYRAAKIAGLHQVPATVRELSDSEVLEHQMVENLQRADLHPVEEAEGYRVLMATGHSVEDVAKKAGKTAGHVGRMLKLLTLELPIKELFHAGHLTLGHALTLARLTPADQDKALRELLNVNYLPAREDMVARTRLMINGHSKRGSAWRLVKHTEAELREWVQRKVLLKLVNVPWSLTDATLVPEAGPCTTCPKHTGSNIALFVDITTDQDVCLDAACYGTKQKASQVVTIQAAAAAGEPLVKLSAKPGAAKLPDDIKPRQVVKQGQWIKAEPGSCSSVRKGLLTDAPGTYDSLKAKPGDVLTICVDQKCKVHKHKVEAPAVAKGATAEGTRIAETQEQRQKREAAERKKLEEREYGIRRIVLAYIATAVAAYPSGIMRYALTLLFGLEDGLDQETTIKAAEALHLKVKAGNVWERSEAAAEALRKHIMGTKVDDLPNVAYVIISADAMVIEDWHDLRGNSDLKESRERMWAFAAAMKVDADAIAAKREEELDAEEELERKAAEASPNAELPSLKKRKKVSAADQAKRKAAAAKKFPAKKVAAKKTVSKPLPIDGKSAGAGAVAEQAGA